MLRSQTARYSLASAPAIHNLQLHKETDHTKPSSLSSAFNNYSSGSQYVASKGPQNISNGVGPQFTGATFNGDVNFGSPNIVNHALADLRLTDPRYDKDRINGEKGGLLKDLCEWIFKNNDYDRWRTNSEARVLWVKGDTGKGKTMLLISMIDQISSNLGVESNNNEDVLVSYFFCQRGNKQCNNAVAVLRGLIFLLVVQKPSLATHFTKKYEQAGPNLFMDVNAWQALSKILTDMLSDLKMTAYLVVDALDECEHDLDQLLKLFVGLASKYPTVKWLFSSREKDSIERQLSLNKQNTLCLELDSQKVGTQVAIYIDFKVSCLKYLSHDENIKLQVTQLIHKKANDTFLWVSLISQELQAADKGTVFKILQAAPAILSQMINYTECCSAARDFVKLGYNKYREFKINNDVNVLREAIQFYQNAVHISKKAKPQYQTGVISACIHLTECQRELSHQGRLTISQKFECLDLADSYVNDALRRAKLDENMALAQRARLEQAVVKARRLLLRLRQPESGASKELKDEVGLVRRELSHLSERFAADGITDSKNWADTWLEQLNKIK